MKNLANAVLSIESFFGIAFSAFVVLILSNWLYNIWPGLKPIVTKMILSLILSIGMAVVADKSLNFDTVFIVIIYSLLIYSSAKGISGTLAKTIRNTPIQDSDKVFGNKE